MPARGVSDAVGGPLGFSLALLSRNDRRWIDKDRGDTCWRDLTAMCYHYETQPVPNPCRACCTGHRSGGTNLKLLLTTSSSWCFPGWWWPAGTLVVAGGLVQLLFQATLVLSGNLSFLNWLTMVPALAALDTVC